MNEKKMKIEFCKYFFIGFCSTDLLVFVVVTGLVIFFGCGDGGIVFNRTFTLDWSFVF